MQRSLSRAAAFAVPAVAVAPVATAVAGTVMLLTGATARRDRTVQLVQAVDALNRVQALPWAALRSGVLEATLPWELGCDQAEEEAERRGVS